ncbi:MAG: type II toxin-antitoxin system RelE/ParE family toxin [Planctomycetes bacterium]|nr:type II toxin-antitoxin system RelE/ParE family toxin [Planctomycetota bacterium]
MVNSSGLYRFRVGEYQLISHIDDGTIQVLVLDVGHRSQIYQRRS